MECDLDIKTKLLTASGLVTDKPCWVYAAIVTGDANPYTRTSLRDGELATDVIILFLSCLSFLTKPIILDEPVRFKNGLYCKFDVGGGYLFVQYKPD